MSVVGNEVNTPDFGGSWARLVWRDVSCGIQGCTVVCFGGPWGGPLLELILSAVVSLAYTKLSWVKLLAQLLFLLCQCCYLVVLMMPVILVHASCFLFCCVSVFLVVLMTRYIYRLLLRRKRCTHPYFMRICTHSSSKKKLYILELFNLRASSIGQP